MFDQTKNDHNKCLPKDKAGRETEAGKEDKINNLGGKEKQKGDTFVSLTFELCLM